MLLEGKTGALPPQKLKEIEDKLGKCRLLTAANFTFLDELRSIEEAEYPKKS